MEFIEIHSAHREPWNKGKLTRQKIPLKLKEIWAPSQCGCRGNHDFFTAFGRYLLPWGGSRPPHQSHRN